MTSFARVCVHRKYSEWKESSESQEPHGTAMGTKLAVSFANIFMCAVETDILSQSNTKPLE